MRSAFLKIFIAEKHCSSATKVVIDNKRMDGLIGLKDAIYPRTKVAMMSMARRGAYWKVMALLQLANEEACLD
jgi:hypothetical protein